MSRRKGAQAEREVVRLLCDRLGEGFAARALNQPRDGGEDIEHDMDHRVCIEVKRWGRNGSLMAAIQQVEEAAIETDRIPVVIFRKDGQPWRALVICDIDEFAELLREME